MTTDDPQGLIKMMDDCLRRSFGIDPERDHDEVCALATTGYVVSCWRNTVVEDIHSGGFVPTARRGSYARDGIPDRDMLRLNVATWRQIRPHVHPEGIDVIAVRALLRDKHRLIVLGSNTFTCGELFAGTWTKLVWHLNEGAWLPLHLKDRFGGDEAATMRYYGCAEAPMPRIGSVTLGGNRRSQRRPARTRHRAPTTLNSPYTHRTNSMTTRSDGW